MYLIYSRISGRSFPLDRAKTELIAKKKIVFWKAHGYDVYYKKVR